MIRKILSMILAAAVIALTVLSAAAYDNGALADAEELYTLGLLKGTGGAFSAESMALDDNATRAQIAVTITRMLGKDEKAAYQKNAHPFTDVPDWASDHVGWLYENYLINGYSDTYFGADDTASVKQFATMLLRVLGYSDADGDFTYDGAVDFARRVGLVDDVIASHTDLVRADMITMCARALALPVKNSFRTLAVKLMDEKVVDEKKAASYGLIRPEALAVYFSDVPSMLPDFTAAMGTDDEGIACVVLSYDEMIEHYGIRVYYTAVETNGTVRPLPLDGTGKVSYRKGDIIYPPGSGAGYLEKSYLYGLDDLTDLRFIVIRTSSEGGNFHMMGKSPIVGLE